METTPTTQSQTILLVEDEESDVFFMKMAMRKIGAASSLQVAEDGQEAIDYLTGEGAFADRTRYPLPALILLDLKLPKVMGMEVLKWIRERAEFDMVVVIMLTSSQQKSDIEKAYSLCANSYLVKPANPHGLTELMTLVKSYWLHFNQPTATVATVSAAPAFVA